MSSSCPRVENKSTGHDKGVEKERKGREEKKRRNYGKIVRLQQKKKKKK